MSKMEMLKSEESLSERLLEFFQENGKTLIWGLSLLFLTLFLLFKFFSGASGAAEKDFIEAAEIAPTLFLSEESDQNLLKLQAIVNRHPELHQEYDGVMAQAYLNQNDLTQATVLFNSLKNRLKDDNVAPFLKNSEIALISDKQEAYKQALLLRDSLKTSSDTLYYYTLIQIAFLELDLGLKREESASWNQILSLTKKETNDLTTLLDALTGEGPSFLAFIQERLNTLNQ